MLSDKDKGIAKGLLEKAKAGKVPWDRPPAPGSVLAGLAALVSGLPPVSVTLRDAKVSIEPSSDEKTYTLKLYNGTGVLLSMSEAKDGEGVDFELMRELYFTGWRQARKYDEAMEAVKQFLEPEDGHGG